MEWVVTLVAMGALAASVAGSMARVARRATAWQDEVEARWRAVAEQIGGELEVGPRRSVSPRRLVLVLAREDAVAAVEVNVAVDPGAPSHTRARSRFALGRGPVFRAWDPDVGELLGHAPPSALPEPLARRLRVMTPDMEATRAAFSPAACAHASAIARGIDLRSSGESIELVWNGVELDAPTLTHALGLVAELAQTGVGTLRALAALDDALYVPVVEGGPAVRLQREHVDVELRAELGPGGPRCSARATTRRAMPALRVEIDAEGVLEGSLPGGVLDPEASPLLLQVGAAVLSIEAEQVELTWAAEPTLAEADAGARLVAIVAAGSSRRGAFR